MRRPLSFLLSGLFAVAILAAGSLTGNSPASAATTIAPTTKCGNDILNVGGRGLICEVTVVNAITDSGGSATVTVRECQGAADAETACTTETTVLTKPVTRVNQCNGSINGGGGTLRCSVRVTNNFIGLTPGVTAATVNQCNGSGASGEIGASIICNPFPATTSGATITQCNGSANGGTLVELRCTATGTKAGGHRVRINQCNDAANGGGALVICSANIDNNVVSEATPVPTAAPTAAPTATPAPTPTPAPGATPAPTAKPAPTARPASTATPRATLPRTDAAALTTQGSATDLRVLLGIVFLVALSLITVFRRKTS